MEPSFLSRSWISPKLEARPSAIHGMGVFARESIPEEEKLMEFGGAYISRAQAYSGDYRSRSVWPIDREHYLASPLNDAGALDEELNHSCDANAWLTSTVTLAARRPIEAGEEVTLDQGTWNFEDASYVDGGAPCSCGAADCRHVLTDHDWQLPHVQQRYAGHFHPIVQALIDTG